MNFPSEKKMKADNTFRTEMASTNTIRRGEVACNRLKILFNILYI